MKRIFYQDIKSWPRQAKRKPLVVRGARQVGKSWLIEEAGRREVGSVAICNFERDPDLTDLFKSDPKTTLGWLETRLRTRITAGKTVLFLDEIQAAPEVLSRLRYFSEEMPRLHVAAAGSLLDFVLAEPKHSVPVGRLTFGYLEPMTFAEFLCASGDERLVETLAETTVQKPVPQPLHQRLHDLLRTYALVGGMPAAVATWLETGSFIDVNRIHRDLITSLRADFAKYRDRANISRIGKVFDALPAMVGQKFVPARVDREEKSAALKDAFRLLCLARLVTPIERTAANGVPLSAEVDERYSRVCLLDVGLFGALSGLDAAVVAKATDVLRVNEGQLAEQLVGQALRAARPFHEDPRLFCWVREARTSNAEVDFVLQIAGQVVPVEVKAGATGRLRSLHVMVSEKKLGLAVRVGSEPLELAPITTTLPNGREVSYELLSVPIYLAGEIPRLVAQALA